MTRARVKKTISWVMLCCGLAGAFFSFRRVIAPNEPQWILQLSWAAVWMTGFTSVLVADDSGITDEDVDRIAHRVAVIMREP